MTKEGAHSNIILNTLEGPIIIRVVGLEIVNGVELLPRYGRNGGRDLSFTVNANLNAFSEDWRTHEKNDYPLRSIVPVDAGFGQRALTQCIHRLAAAEILTPEDLARATEGAVRKALTHQPAKRGPSADPERLRIARKLKIIAQNMTGLSAEPEHS